MSVVPYTAGPLTTGKEVQVLKETTAAAGTKSVIFSVDAENLLVSAAIVSTSGDVNIKVYTQGGDDGQELEIISFPTISSPTSSLVMKKTAQTLQRVRVEVTYTGACSFNIRARGISGASGGVSILGSSSATASAATVTTTAAILVPSALTDRKGVVVKNNNLSGTMYVGFAMAQASSSVGYPVGPQEALALDVDSGVEVYAVADAGTIDVRLLEAGG